MKKYLYTFLLLILLLPVSVFAKAIIVSGDIDTVGSIIRIEGEDFYVIGREDSNHIKLLSKYNLGVGYNFDEPTNKQHVNATGILFQGLGSTSGAPYNGTVKTANATYVNGPLKPYVDRYVEYLNTLGVSVTGRLMDYVELSEIVNNGQTIVFSGGSAYLNNPNNTIDREWVFQTSYWLMPYCIGSTCGPTRINNYNTNIQVGYYYIDSGFQGIRPLIILEVNGELEKIEDKYPETKPNLEQSNYKFGEIYKIGDEEFYVIGKEDETHLKLFPKYNLDCGKDIDNPTYKQNPDAMGWNSSSDDRYSYIGTVSETANWFDRDVESALKVEYGEQYPAYIGKDRTGDYDNYAEYLNTLGAKTTARLISMEELAGLGCDFNNKNCNDAPEWVYSTSYWTGTADYVNSLYYVRSNGKLGSDGTNNYTDFGYRPVILLEIEKEEIIEDIPSDEPEDEKEEKKEEVINPQTGAFISVSMIIALCVLSVSLYLYSKKKTKFKRI